jgi:hypothetical protein
VDSVSTESRLAHMIYRQSTCARAGARNVAKWFRHKVSTKIAAHLFGWIESLMVGLGKDVGEEIFCVCSAPIES